MSPSDQHDQEDLERRLRDAFAAKALHVSDADLDRDREEEFAATLGSLRRTSPVTRVFAGIGAAAAAAAIVGVTVVGLHNGGKHEVVNGLPPATSSSSSSPTSSITTASHAPTGGSSTPALNKPATPGGGLNTKLPSSGAGTTGSSAPKSETSSSGNGPSGQSGPLSAQADSTSAKLSATANQPPAMSSGLPQAGTLDDQEYTGAVPLKDPSGGTPRMLAMPSDLTWQRTAEGDNSLTVRITYLPTDLEAYWQQTLPGEGWVADGAGWKYPGTSYTVSAISDKGSFTVTW